MLSNDVPGSMSHTHDLNDLQRRVQREATFCGSSPFLTSFLQTTKKVRALPLRHLRHGFIALSIPAALLAGTILPSAAPKTAITPVAAAHAVQSSLSAFYGDAAVAAEAVEDEFVFAAVDAALGAPVTTQYAPVAVGVANLRKGPGTNYERIAKLSQGQTVRLLGRSAEWFKVQTKAGTEGWLHGEVVDVASSVSSSLQTINLQQAATTKLKLATTTDSNINLRSGPSTDNEVMAKLPAGFQLEVIGQQEGWLKVATPKGTVGWVTDDYVKVASVASGDAAAPAPAAVKADDSIGGTVSGGRVNLRKGPSTQFGSFGKMAAGTSVSVLARNGDWLKVKSPRGTIGWVSVDLLDLNTKLSAVPVTNDVPALPKVVTSKPAAAAPAAPAAVSAPSGAASGDAASIALNFVGARYIYGGASPRGFDCSGLTSYVYRQIGINLPHKASAQFSTRYGERVGLNNLAAGDLVFFANTAGRGITHVALYVGNGMMVSANTPRTGVQYVSIYSKYWQSHFAGAIRPFR